MFLHCSKMKAYESIKHKKNLYKSHYSKMSIYLMPDDMDTMQKIKYKSIVSKVCKELETHVGFSDKEVAEVTSDSN